MYDITPPVPLADPKACTSAKWMKQREKVTARLLAQRILTDPDVQDHMLQQARAGTLHPSTMRDLMYIYGGRPAYKMDVPRVADPHDEGTASENACVGWTRTSGARCSTSSANSTRHERYPPVPQGQSREGLTDKTDRTSDGRLATRAPDTTAPPRLLKLLERCHATPPGHRLNCRRTAARKEHASMPVISGISGMKTGLRAASKTRPRPIVGTAGTRQN